MNGLRIFTIPGALLLAACPGGEAMTTTTDASTTDASSSSTVDPPTTSTTPTTDDPPTTTGTDPTASTEPGTDTDTDTDTDDATTDGPPASAGARLLYFLAGSEPGRSPALRYIDATGPEPAAAVDLLVAPQGAELDNQLTISPSRRWYIVTAYDDTPRMWVGELGADAVQPPMPVEFPPGVETVVGVSFSDDETLLGIEAGAVGGPFEAFVCPLVAGQPCVPEAWDLPTESDSGVNGAPVFSPDSTRFAYSAYLDPDGSELRVGDVNAPGDAVQVATFTTSFTDFGATIFSPDGNALYFTADAEEASSYQAFVVDLSTDPPGPPELLHPPEGYRRNRFAADLSGMVTWTGEDLYGDLGYVALDGADAAPPVTLNTDGPGRVFAGEFKFSPDGKRVGYLADHAQPGADELYIVDIGGPAPTPPVKVNGPIDPGGAVERLEFLASDPARLLYFANAGLGDELYLADLGAPGTATKLSAPLPDGHTVLLDFDMSADEQRLLYLAGDVGEGRYELFFVDLAGPQPAVKLNGPLPAGLGVRARDIAPDGLRAYYIGAVDDAREVLFQVDVAAPGAPLQLSGPDESVERMYAFAPVP